MGPIPKNLVTGELIKAAIDLKAQRSSDYMPLVCIVFGLACATSGGLIFLGLPVFTSLAPFWLAGFVVGVSSLTYGTTDTTFVIKDK
jgi:hypothetical protein